MLLVGVWEVAGENWLKTFNMRNQTLCGHFESSPKEGTWNMQHVAWEGGRWVLRKMPVYKEGNSGRRGSCMRSALHILCALSNKSTHEKCPFTRGKNVDRMDQKSGGGGGAARIVQSKALSKLQYVSLVLVFLCISNNPHYVRALSSDETVVYAMRLHILYTISNKIRTFHPAPSLHYRWRRWRCHGGVGSDAQPPIVWQSR